MPSSWIAEKHALINRHKPPKLGTMPVYLNWKSTFDPDRRPPGFVDFLICYKDPLTCMKIVLIKTSSGIEYNWNTDRSWDNDVPLHRGDYGKGPFITLSQYVQMKSCFEHVPDVIKQLERLRDIYANW